MFSCHSTIQWSSLPLVWHWHAREYLSRWHFGNVCSLYPLSETQGRMRTAPNVEERLGQGVGESHIQYTALPAVPICKMGTKKIWKHLAHLQKHYRNSMSPGARGGALSGLASHSCSIPLASSELPPICHPWCRGDEMPLTPCRPPLPCFPSPTQVSPVRL